MEGSRFLELESALGYSFKNSALLQVALTHRSYGSEHNERLEFLGDSILNCAVSTLLFKNYPLMDEGKMSRVRSHLVNQDCLVLIGRRLHLEDCLLLGAGESRGTANIKNSIIADALEAIFGAIFLDSCFDSSRDCVIRLLDPVLKDTPIESMGKDPKTRLQEFLQSKRLKLPIYRILIEGGKSASPEFSVECTVEDLSIVTTGQGHSRRMAEQQAAQTALTAILDEHGDSAVLVKSAGD